MDSRDTEQNPHKNLEVILPEFKAIYETEYSSYHQCVERVMRDLDYILNGSSIKHIPVTGRVKRWESIAGTGMAKGAVQRRQQNRLDLQTAKEKMAKEMGLEIAKVEEKWEIYCRTFKLNKDSVGHFQDVEEARKAIHDIVGCRSALYFPNDIRRVGEVLKTAGYSNDQASKRMGGPDDVKALRENMERRTREADGLDDPDDLDEPDDLEVFETRGKQFSGYGAVHLVKRIPARLIPQQSDWSSLRVEIQVGTVLMHAWSEVEHDIIYKSHGSKPTADQTAYLDIINGLVLAGEVALRRFRSPLPFLEMEGQGRGGNDPASPGHSIAGPVGQAAHPVNLGTAVTNPQAHKAESFHEFRTWFCEYYAIHDRRVPEKWVGINQLFQVLALTNGSVTHDTTRRLMESTFTALERHQRADIFDDALPLLMLEGLCVARKDLHSGNTKGIENAKTLTGLFAKGHQLAESLGCPVSLLALRQMAYQDMDAFSKVFE